MICDSPAGIERGAILAMRMPMPPSSSPILKYRRCVIRSHHRDARIPRPKRQKKVSGLISTCSLRDTIRRGLHAGRCSRSMTFLRSSPRRCLASSLKARTCCGLQMSARRSRLAIDKCASPRLYRGGQEAQGRRCRNDHSARQEGCSISCSEGGRHEPFQVTSKGRLGAGCARAAPDPARPRTKAIGQPDLLNILREEILAVVARHVTLDPDKVQIKMDRGEPVSTLEVDIEIPSKFAMAAPA